MDALGNPIHVQLSSGDIHDSVIAENVLDHIDLKPNETTVLADKAYGSYDFREYIANRDTVSVFPRNPTPLIPGSVTGPCIRNGISLNVFSIN